MVSVEEEAATVYEEYIQSLRPGQTAKPVVGFIAGQSTQRGLMYGHSGAVWWEEEETAGAKKQRWANAGFVMAPTLGDVAELVKGEVSRLGV